MTIRALPPSSPVRPAQAPARQPMVEVDASVRPTPDGWLRPTGRVTLEHGFLLRLVKHLLRNPDRFRDLQVRFDPRTGTFAATGRVCVKGVWLPISTQARPIIDGNRTAFQFVDPRIVLPGTGRGIGGQWLAGPLSKIVANALNDDQLDAVADPKQGAVTLGTNALLSQIDGLPDFVRLDEKATKLGVATSAQGDVTVSLTAPGVGPAANPTPASDLAFNANPEELAGLLRPLLGPDLSVDAVRPRAGGFTIACTTEYTPVSTAVTTARALLIAIAGRADEAAQFEESHVRGPLDLDVRVAGTRLQIRPSLGAAVDRIAQTLTDAGLQPTTKDGAITVDVGPWLASKGMHVTDVVTTPTGVAGHLTMDIDGRIHNPALRP